MLVKRTLQFLPAQLFAPLAQFLSIIIWTHIASAETIGVVTLISTQQELIRTVFIGWWSHYLLRFITDKNKNKQELLAANRTILLISSFLQIIVVGILIATFFKEQFNLPFVIVAVVFVIFRNINLHNISIKSVEGKVFEYNLLSLSGPVMGLGIGVFLLDYYGDNIIWPIAGYALGELFGFIISLMLNRPHQFCLKLNKNILEDAKRYSLPLLVAGVFVWVSLNTVRFIIEFKLGIDATGEFSVGFGLGQRAATLASMLVTSASLPLAIRVMQEQGYLPALRQLSNNFVLLMTVMLPALVGMYSVNDLLVKLLVAEEFWAVTLEVLPWAILSGGVFTLSHSYINHYFVIADRTKYIIFLDAFTAILICILSLPLINYFGVKGGVIAMSLSASIIVIGMFIYLLSCTKFIFPLKATLYVLFSVLMMYISVIYTRTQFESLVSQLVASIVVGGLLYAILISYHYRQPLIAFVVKRSKSSS